jgi:hypothetical protein
MSVCQVLAVCILWGAASAQGADGITEALRPVPQWEMAPEISVFQYEEPGLMKDKGILYGVAGAYTRDHGDGLFRVEGEFALGTVNYEGSLLDGTPYRMEDSHDYLMNVRLFWGRHWALQGWDTQLYAGLGYRGLKDDSTQDPAGYDRQSAYFYLPVSLKAYHDLTDHWQIGVGGEVDLLLLGLQFSQLPNDGVLTNMQWPGIGARTSLELRYRTPSVDLALAPFAQYWWVDDSTATDGWYEPRNQTLQYGLSLIWRF